MSLADRPWLSASHWASERPDWISWMTGASVVEKGLDEANARGLLEGGDEERDRG